MGTRVCWKAVRLWHRKSTGLAAGELKYSKLHFFAFIQIPNRKQGTSVIAQIHGKQFHLRCAKIPLTQKNPAAWAAQE